MNKMNFGCGPDIHKGWLNVDKVLYGDHERHDILTDWPYMPGHMDIIVANHVLHMFDYKEYMTVLTKLRNDLKKGGVLRIVEFDPLKAFDAYQRGDHAALIIPDEVEPTLDGKFNAYLTWYGTRHTILTAQGVIERLLKAGFSQANIVAYHETSKPPAQELDSRPNESFFVEAVK
jgi:predicted SAM-dependent methyltransferase